MGKSARLGWVVAIVMGNAWLLSDNDHAKLACSPQPASTRLAKVASENGPAQRDIVFDLCGVGIKLDRDYANANGLGYTKKQTATYWKVRDGIKPTVDFLFRNLPAPKGDVNCDRERVLIFWSEDVPVVLRSTNWTQGTAEAAAYPGLSRITVDFDGSFEPVGLGLPTNFVDRYRAETAPLRTSNGNFPVLDCGVVRCRVTMEIEAPLYAMFAYSSQCSLDDASAVLQSIRQQLRDRIVR